MRAHRVAACQGYTHPNQQWLLNGPWPWRTRLKLGLKLTSTKPHRSQVSSKVENLVQTALQEQAYAQTCNRSECRPPSAFGCIVTVGMYPRARLRARLSLTDSVKTISLKFRDKARCDAKMRKAETIEVVRVQLRSNSSIPALIEISIYTRSLPQSDSRDSDCTWRHYGA